MINLEKQAVLFFIAGSTTMLVICVLTVRLRILDKARRIMSKIRSRFQKQTSQLHWEGQQGFIAAIRQRGVDLIETQGSQDLMQSYMQIESPNRVNNWPNAWMIMALLQSKCSDKEMEVIDKFFARLLAVDGTLTEEPMIIDHAMIGYSLLEMFERTQDSRFLNGANQIADFLTLKIEKSPSGTIPYLREQPELALVDTLGMLCPFLARYAKQTGDVRALDLCILQFKEFMQRGFDQSMGLPFHAYLVSTHERLGIIGWGRGTGWAALGLVNALEYIPSSDINYSLIADQFRKMMQSARQYQRSDGTWGWALAIPHSHVDTSAIAFLGYAIVRGQRLGLLYESYWQNIAADALSALMRHTSSDGYVESALMDCQGVGLYPYRFGRAVWAQAPAIALASLINN